MEFDENEIDEKEINKLNQTLKLTADATILMVQRLIDGLLTPDFSKKIAEFEWQHYKDLISTGFTEDQAMRLVTSSLAVIGNANKK